MLKSLILLAVLSNLNSNSYHDRLKTQQLIVENVQLYDYSTRVSDTLEFNTGKNKSNQFVNLVVNKAMLEMDYFTCPWIDMVPNVNSDIQNHYLAKARAVVGSTGDRPTWRESYKDYRFATKLWLEDNVYRYSYAEMELILEQSRINEEKWINGRNKN